MKAMYFSGLTKSKVLQDKQIPVIRNKYCTGVTVVFNSVVIKFDSLEQKYPGGIKELSRKFNTFESDCRLVSISFMGNEWGDVAEELHRYNIHCTQQSTDYYLLADGLRPEIEFHSFNDNRLEISQSKGKNNGFLIRLKEKPLRISYLEYKKYRSVGTWWKNDGHGKFPIQVPAAISKLQKEHHLSFHEAFEHLVRTGAIILIA